MISFIKGFVVDIEEDKIVLENNNIGYNIFVPSTVLSNINRTGDEIKIHTYMNVREDSITLFGFNTSEELFIFKKMIAVSGIGPKGALAILSTLSVDNLKLAIISEDAKAISKAPGIGSKIASKLILELKDKFTIDDYEKSFAVDVENNAGNETVSVQKDAIDALISLGYSSSQAYNAVRKISSKNCNDVSEIIKLALKELV